MSKTKFSYETLINFREKRFTCLLLHVTDTNDKIIIHSWNKMKFKQLADVSFIYYIQLLTIGIKTWIKLPYSAKLYEKNNCSYHLKVTQRSLRRSPKHCFRHSPRRSPNYSPKHSPFLHSLFWFLGQPPLIHRSIFFWKYFDVL